MPTRTIRCTIEMELIEGDHFNGLLDKISDEEAIYCAESNFLDMIAVMEPDTLLDFVQTKIIEGVS